MNATDTTPRGAGTTTADRATLTMLGLDPLDVLDPRDPPVVALADARSRLDRHQRRDRESAAVMREASAALGAVEAAAASLVRPDGRIYPHAVETLQAAARLAYGARSRLDLAALLLDPPPAEPAADAADGVSP